MSQKEPVLLVVLIETAALRWFVGGIDLEGQPQPILRSEPGNLRPYLGREIDDQVSFLRHRLAGVLQRGCDRLWGVARKPCQIVFVADALYPDADADLSRRVAQNFVEWMSRPPVAYFLGSPADGNRLELVAGSIEEPHRAALESGLQRMWDLAEDESQWELAPVKQATQEC